MNKQQGTIEEISKEITKENIDQILQDEVGKVFAKVLEDAGVFKRTKEGQEAFEKFIKSL